MENVILYSGYFSRGNISCFLGLRGKPQYVYPGKNYIPPITIHSIVVTLQARKLAKNSPAHKTISP